MDLYILDAAGNPVREPDIMAWARWYESADRIVARTPIGTEGALVSTVFLGIDHSFSRVGPPLLYETLTFGLAEEHQERYSTRQEALAGHWRIVALAKGG